nr:LCP family protein [Paenibacillus sp. PDC88]
MKRWFKVTLGCIAAVVLIGFGFVWYTYDSLKSTANSIYEPREPFNPVSIISGGQEEEPKELYAEKIKETTPFSVLLLGVDERENDIGRSDTMIVLTVNPKKKTMLMFNIPRDTRTEIVGMESMDKINHAYAFGGVNMSIETVEQFLDTTIDYYVKINMEGFSSLIDILGGIEVDNPFHFEYEGEIFEKGTIKLDGESALKYSRMRFSDPRGDLGRNERQRTILQQVIKNGMQISTVTNLEKILEELQTYVKTDVTFEDMKHFIINYSRNLERLEMVEIKGHGQRINGLYYFIVDENERERITKVINRNLDRN